MSAEPAVVASVAVAYPPATTQEELWCGYFREHYRAVAPGLARRIFANSGVVTRHGVVNPAVEDPSHWSTGARMRRYLSEALPLSKDAAGRALAGAGVAASEIGLLVVCSCTGYVTPGLDILLARDLGFPPQARRVFVGHMGCYAALPGLGVAADYVAQHQRPAVLLCVELTSLHGQPPSAEPDQVVAHALFSDAAAATVLLPGRSGYAIREVAALTDTATADYMTWTVTDLGFRMGLSSRVPEVLGEHVAPLVTRVLDQHGFGVGDVAGWAVHPGGPRVIDVVAQRLELPASAVLASRRTLAEHGNCSSSTVLMILERLLADGAGAARRPLMLMAFGPGLTLYAALLAGPR